MVAVLYLHLADGTTRSVFASIVPGRVIKRMRRTVPRVNWREYEIWNAGRQTRWRKMLGEVFAISETGNLLVMERLDDLEEGDWSNSPDIPEWLKDTKPKNIGKTAEGVVKCHDYGLCNMTFPLNAVEKMSALRTA